MATVSGYARPGTIDEALALLGGGDAVVIGGGTKVNATPTPGPVLVVDLQALGLDRIELTGEDTLAIGAGVTLARLAESDAPDVVRLAARRELPSTLRDQATVGGCVVTADPSSELLTALLAYEALVTTVGENGIETHALDAFLSAQLPPGRIVTTVLIASSGHSAAARVGRTSADRPIVAAVARRTETGKLLLAVAGVDARPVLVAPDAELDPPGDFRGSIEYRRALAACLTERVLEAVR